MEGTYEDFTEYDIERILEGKMGGTVVC